jgi:type VI secretion system protein ImpF
MITSEYLKTALAEPHREKGAPIPLFDRLIDEDLDATTEVPSRRFYNCFELIQSIEREVCGILNTRANARRNYHHYLEKEKSNFGLPEMFGLPDFSQYDGANTGDWPKIAKLCDLAIETYEPRLKNVRTTINGFNRQEQCLEGMVEADLNIPEFQGEVTFPVLFKAF